MFSKRLVSGIAKTMIVALAMSTFVMPLSACKGDQELSNDDSPLVLATDELDGVFNPFFYTSGPDGEVVGQTQIGMLSSDKNGKPVAGWDEPCVSLAFSTVTTDERIDTNVKDYEHYYTDYYFAIKDGLKFSNDAPLTIRDVLFNMYFYLDPAYTGSSTMYSVAIKGLGKYRNQTEDEDQAGASSAYFDSLADARIAKIFEWADDEDSIWGEWIDYEPYEGEETIESDILQVHELFKEEIQSDWTAMLTVDVEKDWAKYVDANNNRLITKTWQVFLYSYGGLTLTFIPEGGGVAKHYEMNYNYNVPNNFDQLKEEKQKELLCAYAWDKMFTDAKRATEAYKTNLKNVISFYATANTFREYIRAKVIEHEIYGEGGSGLLIKNVEGIQTFRDNKLPYRKTDGTIDYTDLKDKNGTKTEYDILHITIDGVDPKAIQNFSFTVAPGSYYGRNWDKTDPTSSTYDKDYHGLPFGDTSYMRTVRENHVPIGAGPYRVATESGGRATQKGQFFKDKAVYLARNDNFLLGKPKIRLLRFKTINNNLLYDAVKNGDVHYASPSMKAEKINLLQNQDSGTLSSASAWNLGYGYIGINARYVKNIWIRRVIMKTLDPSLSVSAYYGTGNAEVIYRPMSKTLKGYYPEDARAYVYKDKETGEEFSYGYVGEDKEDLTALTDILTDPNKGKCTVNGSTGKLTDENGNPLKYTFTVAGDSDDHPANAMLVKAANKLNDIGFDITVTHDSNALSKLANGQLTVWAAAWSSSSDPDMYQVYHKNSTATSTLAWGYNYLKGNQSTQYERDLLDDLAYYIEEGRETTEVESRAVSYHTALDLVMELAVEFPTYQRMVYYVWQKGVLDESTMFTGAEVGPYRSPLSEIWNVSFK